MKLESTQRLLVFNITYFSILHIFQFQCAVLVVSPFCPAVSVLAGVRLHTSAESYWDVGPEAELTSPKPVSEVLGHHLISCPFSRD